MVGAATAGKRVARQVLFLRRIGITLRGNCVVELYGLDMTTAYQVGHFYLSPALTHY